MTEALTRPPETNPSDNPHYISDAQIASMLAAHLHLGESAARRRAEIEPLADKAAQDPNAAFAPRPRPS